MQKKVIAHVDSKYPTVGDEVDGRRVREHVPNYSSINATLGVHPGAYDVLDGTREVQMSEFSDPGAVTPRTKALAEEIKQSGELNPLIIGVDPEGPFIMEGAHRFDALRILGAKSFPAVVAIDLTHDYGELPEKTSEKAPSNEEPKQEKQEEEPFKDELVAALAKKEFWHVPPAEGEGAYAKRGKFLASSFKDAEFYGRPLDEAQHVQIKNPIIGTEQEIADRLGLEPQHEGMSQEEMNAHDRKWALAAKKAGYDAIVTVGGKQLANFKRTGRIPSQMEVNDLSMLKDEEATPESPKEEPTKKEVTLVDKKPERRAEFAEAVKNTPGAEVHDDGSMTLNISRRQSPDQAGAVSPRTGVFFNPEAESPWERHYTGRGGYGGEQKVTEYGVKYKNPIVAKGSSGGKVPERAYDSIKGKDAYDEMRSDVLDAIGNRSSLGRDEVIKRVGDLLEKYGGDRNMAFDIVDAPSKSNNLAYAIQEHIVAHALREAGHDAIVGFSNHKGQPRLSEVFDLTREEFPVPGQAHVPNFYDLGKNSHIASEKGYVYHATSGENAQDIAESGRLDVHKPNFGTDQTVWPDGAKEKRSYFTRRADHAYQFAPDNGNPVILRMKEDPSLHKTESTGDVYATKAIKSKNVEFLAEDGRWYPLAALVD